jgi:hypothetical protein
MEQESLFARHLNQPPGRIEAFQNSFLERVLQTADWAG